MSLAFSVLAAIERAGAPTNSPEGAPVSEGWRVKWVCDELARLRAAMPPAGTPELDVCLVGAPGATVNANDLPRGEAFVVLTGSLEAVREAAKNYGDGVALVRWPK